MQTVPLKELKELAEKHYLPIAILIQIDLSNGVIAYTSYGKTKALCDEAEEIADDIYEFLDDIRPVDK